MVAGAVVVEEREREREQVRMRRRTWRRCWISTWIVCEAKTGQVPEMSGQK